MTVKKSYLIKIVIVGASGFGREVLWTLNDCNKKSTRYKILGFIDDSDKLQGKLVDNIPVLGGLEWFSSKSAENVYCVVAIGDTKDRFKVVKVLEKKNVKFVTVIHPTVISSEFVEIGCGSIIQAGSILTTNIRIGNHVHINIDSTVGHDSIIEDFVTLNPGVHVNGNTLIETGAYIGAGTTMKQEIKIGKWSVIGAGTVLISDVPEHSMYVGVPGRKKKEMQV